MGTSWGTRYRAIPYERALARFAGREGGALFSPNKTNNSIRAGSRSRECDRPNWAKRKRRDGGFFCKPLNELEDKNFWLAPEPIVSKGPGGVVGRASVGPLGKFQKASNLECFRVVGRRPCRRFISGPSW